VSSTYKTIKELGERYGDSYPETFPYQSKLLLAFQTIGGRDVLCFAMYVNEYGPHCPQPNTNRTYISYLDSVPYLETKPEGQRTLVYHAIINGYLQYAASVGFEYAHIWVAPPQTGDEYIFHCRPEHPKHGRRQMSIKQLRSWYEKLLQSAQDAGIVSETSDVFEANEALKTIRDFPLFSGDFFPEEMRKMLNEGDDKPSDKPRQGTGPPALQRHSSYALAQNFQKHVLKRMRQRYLVARLARPKGAKGDDGSLPSKSHELVDSRSNFLAYCFNRHWQFNELRRAQYTTMMILANLGGPA